MQLNKMNKAKEMHSIKTKVFNNKSPKAYKNKIYKKLEWLNYQHLLKKKRKE